MRWKEALTRLHARHDCQSSLNPDRHLDKNTEKLNVCDENSWSKPLCFVTVTPFYEPITEVVLLTCYLHGCFGQALSLFNFHGNFACFSHFPPLLRANNVSLLDKSSNWHNISPHEHLWDHLGRKVREQK